MLDDLSVDARLMEIDLRLSIFNGDTSRTLGEMQEIESWILGDKK